MLEIEVVSAVRWKMLDSAVESDFAIWPGTLRGDMLVELVYNNWIVEILSEVRNFEGLGNLVLLQKLFQS
jgi:hypothetical protein